VLLLLSDRRTEGRLRSCNSNIQAGYRSGMWRDGTGYIGLVGWLSVCMYICLCMVRESRVYREKRTIALQIDEALRRGSIVSRVEVVWHQGSVRQSAGDECGRSHWHYIHWQAEASCMNQRPLCAPLLKVGCGCGALPGLVPCRLFFSRGIREEYVWYKGELQ
jgi:hypothetical protein